MRVALLHNTSAGSEDHSDAELTRLIEDAGHDVAYIAGELRDLLRLLHEAPCDLVVVAGGDGTVGRTACELSGWQIPLAILPLGTANNTARTLGLPAKLKKLPKKWGKSPKTPFDLGLMDDGKERLRFSECAGWGVFARTICEAKRRDAAGGVHQTLRRDRKLFRKVVANAEARPYRISVDGRDCSGAYLMVEIMNVSHLGPQLPLSPSSNPGDGQFELILIGDAERKALDRLARPSLHEPALYRTEHGRNIRVETEEPLHHRDGNVVRRAQGPRGFELSVEPAAIHYLL